MLGLLLHPPSKLAHSSHIALITGIAGVIVQGHLVKLDGKRDE
jgi:hypothetical protein